MPTLELQFAKRDWCYGYNCTSTWNWARWVLFVLFVLGLILLVLSAIRINKRRGMEGRQPIVGTAWMTPPSYLQSQTQNPPYVPQYSAETNDNDMGYYDGQGNFHANPKMREAFANNPVHLNNLVPDSTGQQSHRTGENENVDFQRDFSRYYGNTATPTIPQASPLPPAFSASSPEANGSPSQATEEFQPPQDPPPAHLK